MDANRFDAIVRSIDWSMPRRVAASGALGLTLQVFLNGLGQGLAAKKRKKKKCKGGKKKCGKKCIPNASCCSATDCPTGAACEEGACVCPDGQTVCDGVCADLATDGSHCGGCGNACVTGECVHGACTCAGINDCPESCICNSRSAGAPNACAGGLPGAQCVDDADCPLGAVCRLGNTCSTPCEG